MSDKERVYKIFLVIAIIIFIANILDIITTFAGLKNPNNYENNPIMDFLIKNLGFAAYFVKFILIIIILPIKNRFFIMNHYIEWNLKQKKPIKQINFVLLFTAYFIVIYWLISVSISNLMLVI